MVNLAERIERGELNARIELVLSTRHKAKGVQRAQELGLPVEVVPRKEYETVEAFSHAVWGLIRPLDVELVCFAGFLSLLHIPADYEGRVMNIHPALLPKFGGQGMYGRYVHEAVLEAGETETGCTVHLCDNEYDRGEILLQRKCPVEPGDDPDTLAARVFEQECEAYPEAIRLFAEGKIGEGNEPREHEEESRERE